ncbi:flocculation protein FLO11-like [Zingiber officinale]|uniref:Uncharacterized protein n=1 Tax=Zingiber officinale TaxID=94328 RepID=A0A8J5GIS2_ZINOF|nr:flocculation protein FLO11-like [Zingiber officinale]KAG6504247.1 hypothetical protein ZIOFF_036578 [Zingiber officinale]
MSRVSKGLHSALLLRRGTGLAGGGRFAADGDSLELDLFSATRFAGPPLGSGPGSETLEGSLVEFSKSVSQARVGRSGMDDLLDAELGKHDYDWLLTPPGTPQAAPLVSRESQVPAAPAKRTVVRSASTTRASRLSASQTENNHSVRPTRSSSVTRASVSSNYLSNHNRTSVLNTSSASVTSRPSTPSKRPVTPSGKAPPLTSCSVPTRSSTPVKTRSTYGSPVVKSETSRSSRPATPTRSQISTNTNLINTSVISSSSSRPSTPTRQPIVRSTPSAPAAAGRSPSVGRLPSSISRTPSSTSRPSSPSPRPRPLVNSASSSRPSSPNRPRAPLASASSRPSSPNPRLRAPVQPIDLPDFPNDAPPNLRTKLPDRPLSAGRTRPGMALTVQANLKSEPVVPSSSNRRISLPVVSRSKFPENQPKALSYSNGHYNSLENQKPVLSEAGLRRSPKPALSTESTGFGRTISKKSLDMAIKHMDIRQSLGGIRGASIFPHSIRSTVPKNRIIRSSEAIVPVSNDESFTENGSYDGAISVDSHVTGSHNLNSTNKTPHRENLMIMEQMNDLDLYGSYRYDAMLMKEDLKNTSWLLSTDDKSDQGSLFDHRFEPLPELFDPLL